MPVARIIIFTNFFKQLFACFGFLPYICIRNSVP